jgi:hypothetical protein
MVGIRRLIIVVDEQSFASTLATVSTSSAAERFYQNLRSLGLVLAMISDDVSVNTPQGHILINPSSCSGTRSSLRRGPSSPSAFCLVGVNFA